MNYGLLLNYRGGQADRQTDRQTDKHTHQYHDLAWPRGRAELKLLLFSCCSHLFRNITQHKYRCQYFDGVGQYEINKVKGSLIHNPCHSIRATYDHFFPAYNLRLGDIGGRWPGAWCLALVPGVALYGSGRWTTVKMVAGHQTCWYE